MKTALLSSRELLAVSAVVATILGGVGCAGTRPPATSSFADVRPVLEANCIHCHGPSRLAHMPAFPDTASLARLIGPTNWIVPGQPERSRFYQVVTFTDTQPGAMPPTGHAISRAAIEKLRAWIAAGASLPEGAPVVFIARGVAPQSR